MDATPATRVGDRTPRCATRMRKADLLFNVAAGFRASEKLWIGVVSFRLRASQDRVAGERRGDRRDRPDSPDPAPQRYLSLGSKTLCTFSRSQRATRSTSAARWRRVRRGGRLDRARLRFRSGRPTRPSCAPATMRAAIGASKSRRATCSFRASLPASTTRDRQRGRHRRLVPFSATHPGPRGPRRLGSPVRNASGQPVLPECTGTSTDDCALRPWRGTSRRNPLRLKIPDRD